jgi:hypothetical protein
MSRTKTDSRKENKVEPRENQSKKTTLKYRVAKNYFVQYNVEQLQSVKIDTKEKFSEIFGMATTMGPEGKPTAIDFEKEYVIAVLHPETNSETHIEPLELQKYESSEMELSYRIKTGGKQSYSTRPFFALIVEKSETGNIRLQEIK